MIKRVIPVKVPLKSPLQLGQTLRFPPVMEVSDASFFIWPESRSQQLSNVRQVCTQHHLIYEKLCLLWFLCPIRSQNSRRRDSASLRVSASLHRTTSTSAWLIFLLSHVSRQTDFAFLGWRDIKSSLNTLIYCKSREAGSYKHELHQFNLSPRPPARWRGEVVSWRSVRW